MGKSVYSLVLDDDVVNAVDKLAHSMSTSRSNLINTILAQKVELDTPQMRMESIFSAMQSLIDSHFQLIDRQSSSRMSIKSMLEYKYKPTIRYSVELARDTGGKVGSLKVRLRTTSGNLMGLMESFFTLWRELEKAELSHLFTGGFPGSISQGCFTRDFYSPARERLNDKDIGMAIGRYIRLIDKCIQQYFDNLDDPQRAARLTEQTYKQYLDEGVLIL